MSESKPTAVSCSARFAVWRWKRPWWAWCLLVVSLPAVYFLSAVPFVTLAIEVANRTGHSQVYLMAEDVYRPVFWLGKRSEFAGLVLAWEQHVMLSLFGRSA